MAHHTIWPIVLSQQEKYGELRRTSRDFTLRVHPEFLDKVNVSIYIDESVPRDQVCVVDGDGRIAGWIVNIEHPANAKRMSPRIEYRRKFDP